MRVWNKRHQVDEAVSKGCKKGTCRSCCSSKMGQYEPRDRLLLCKGASGSALVTHATVAWMLHLLDWLLAVPPMPSDRRGGGTVRAGRRASAR